MAGIRKERRLYDVESHGGHIYKGPAKAAKAMTGPVTFEAFIIVLSGCYRAEWEEGGKTMKVEARAGDVVFRGSRRRWLESNEQGTPLVAMVLYFLWVNPRGGAVLPVKVMDRDGLIRTLGHVSLTIQDSHSADRQMMENGYIAAIVSEFLKARSEDAPGLQAQVIEYVYLNLRRAISLEELARHVGMGPRQLQRTYKAQTGMTPMEQVRRVRVEGAVRWLINGERRPLKVAAQRLGFCNEQAMCARIKKHTGLTVGELRAKKRAADGRRGDGQA